MMSMDALRWILLGIAVVVIVAIYFFSRTRTKEPHQSPLDAANDIPSFSAEKQLNNEWVDGVGPVRVLEQDEGTHQNIKTLRNDMNSSQAPDWDSLYEKPQEENKASTFDEHTGSPDHAENALPDAENSPSNVSIHTEKNSPVESEQALESSQLKADKASEHENIVSDADESQGAEVDGAAIDDVISVYVLASDEEPVITGDKILSASYALNLEHGEMNIFHRHSEAPAHDILFSMANILNPGWFELDKINELETRGMSFFMQVNLVDHPARVLDDMLICAHQMSTMLGGVLCNAQRKPLDEAHTKTLREKVKHLEKLKAQSI